MTAFATVDDPSAPIRVVLVGAGAMGRNWLRVIDESPDVTLVGLVDLDVDLAESVVAERGLEDVVVGPSLATVAQDAAAQAVVNVTVPVAHYAVTTEALFAGLPVLTEKPIAPLVSEAMALAAASETTGRLLMTSQSRRYYRALAEFKREVGTLGRIGILETRFFRGPHFGGFREDMEQPLLVDMAIHAFDVARYLLDADPASVWCESFNPEWSWYRGDAAAIASFEFDSGARYSYSGSWCSQGLETSWNGEWRASGPGGSATWDGEGTVRVERTGPASTGDAVAPESTDDGVASPPAEVVAEEITQGMAEEIAGALEEFVSALRSGRTPSGEVHSNILSLAMVEAATTSAAQGRRVQVADLLERSYADAVSDEKSAPIRAALELWGSARAGLGRTEAEGGFTPALRPP